MMQARFGIVAAPPARNGRIGGPNPLTRNGHSRPRQEQ